MRFGDSQIYIHDHTEGLNGAHSNLLICDSGNSIVSSDIANCSSIEYGGQYSLRGSNKNSGYMTPHELELRGWLDIPVITKDGIYDIDAISLSNSTNKRAYKIIFKANDGYQGAYYLQYRRFLNMDSGFQSYLDVNGLVVDVVHASLKSLAYSSVVDFTPCSYDQPVFPSWGCAFGGLNLTLKVNKSFVDPFSGVNITTISMNSTTIRIKVQNVSFFDYSKPNISFASFSFVKNNSLIKTIQTPYFAISDKDNGVVDRGIFYMDGVPDRYINGFQAMIDSTSVGFGFDPKPYANGTHIIRLDLYDLANNKGSFEATWRIQN